MDKYSRVLMTKYEEQVKNYWDSTPDDYNNIYYTLDEEGNINTNCYYEETFVALETYVKILEMDMDKYNAWEYCGFDKAGNNLLGNYKRDYNDWLDRYAMNEYKDYKGWFLSAKQDLETYIDNMKKWTNLDIE